MPEKTFQKLDQEKVYQILSKGAIFTMEDDLKEAMQSQKIKTNLIPEQIKPEQAKKEVNTKAIFAEESRFNPFQKSSEPIRKPSIPAQPQATPVGPESAEQLLQKRKKVLEKIKNQKVDLESILQKIEIIKERKDQIEKQEQEARDSSQKHIFEEQRWQIEEKFKQQQDLQWLREEEIEKSQMVFSKIDNDYRIVQNRKVDLERKQLENQKLLQNLELSRQKEEILNKGKEALKDKPVVEAQYNEFLLQKNKIEQDLLVITQEEQKIEEQSKNIEKQIKAAMDAGERRKLEQERREIEKKRQIQEKKRWETEKLQEAIKNNTGLKEKLLKLKQEEQAVNQKVAEIEAQLLRPLNQEAQKATKTEAESVKENVVAPPVQSSIIDEATPLPEALAGQPTLATPARIASQNIAGGPEALLAGEAEKEVVQQIRLNAKEREQELIQKQFVQKQVVKEERAMDEEQSLRLEEEARSKAIEKLRQIAEQEQKKLFTGRSGKLKGPLLKEEILKKLTKVSPEEEAQRKDFLSRISQKSFDKLRTGLPRQKVKSFEEGVVFHPMIRKVSLFGKITIRVLIVVLIIGVIGGLYFAITKLTKKQTTSPLPISNNATTTPDASSTIEWPNVFLSTTTPSTTSSEQTQPTTTPAVVIPPTSLIPISKNNIFSYQNYFQSIASSIKTILENKNQYNSFEQISIFDENQQVFLSATQLFAMMGVALPQEINQENGTSTTLIYSSKYGNRLGFILATSSASSLLFAFQNWENQAETSTAPIFDLMGKTLPALKKTFVNLKYKTAPIRCQTFTKTDLGICYSAYKNYFIWASSLEQAQRIVDKLP
ncbi:MAG: hypothetical protein Q7R99_03880 [bacterium]|nr:hypothetical protein [bacterium]